MEALPEFRYHPDPLATGSIEVNEDTACLSCSRTRGYIYTGPVATEKNFALEDHLCPWCIADGSAARRFSASFGYAGMLDGVSEEVRREIETRTPGFIAWQQETWMSCCGDAAAFLGIAGAKDLRGRWAEAIPAVKQALRDDYDVHGKELEEFFDSLAADSDPSAYIFRCLHCNRFLAYVDQA